jgi:predicted nucleic acid-binding protein
LTRPHPQESVSQWLDNADDEQLYLSVISLGEILKGITILPPSKRRTDLQQWLDGILRPWFGDRILRIDEPIAERWGVLAGQCKLRGRPLKVADGLIAATALVHELAVVTRNVNDFDSLGLQIVNPWN